MRAIAILLLLTAAVHAQQGKPGELLTAPLGPNGTWNLYQPSEKPLTWQKAQDLAAATIDPAGGSKKPGHLATIASVTENMFVYHYVRGSVIWIGLTDNEKFPRASEAGQEQDRGWAWVSGEPVTYTNWQTAEPGDGDLSPDNKGEDALAIEVNGFWTDRPMGAHGQEELICPFMIEWDVQSPQPVPGARVIGAILPARWPVLDVLPDDEVKSGPWVCVQTLMLPGDPRMEDLAKHLVEHWTENLPFRITDSNFRMAMTNPRNAFGWIFSPGIQFPGEITNNFGFLARARLVIPKAGTYTFNVHADDGFALRLGTHKWKSAHGGGGIDPSDPATFFAYLLSTDCDARGVIELPAGEVPVELFYINGGAEGAVQIMTAEGAFPDDGATDTWRLLGHKSAAKVPWPGISDAGWKVSLSAPGEDRKVTRTVEVLNALLRLEAPGITVAEGMAAINFRDPECSRHTRFPGAVPFPGDPPGPQDDRVILAEATLVIPADGVWNIGITGDDLFALQIAGQKWERIVRDAAGRRARIDGDSLFSRRTTNFSQECIGEVKLARGNYPIRALSWDGNGTSNCNVFAAPAGYPARLLTKSKAGEEADHPGLTVLPFKP